MTGSEKPSVRRKLRCFRDSYCKDLFAVFLAGCVCSLLAGREILDMPELLEYRPVAAVALLVLLFLFAGGLYLLRKYLHALHQNKENRK